jgi:hypothetical protein
MEEIEYLTEEQLASISVPTLDLYYVYFDEAGNINSITNEKKHESALSFVMFEFSRIEKFFNGTDNFINYKVSLADKDTPVLIKKVEEAGANINFLKTIDNPRADNSVLVVEWNLIDKAWNFYIPKKHKEQLLVLGINVTLLFFITIKNNMNFIIRSVSIDTKELLESDIVTIPWTTTKEANISDISIITKKFFDSYGLEIYE